MGPLFFFLAVIFGVIIASLIPAFIAKLLMGAVFKHRVSYGMVLLATVLGTLFTFAAFFGLMYYAQGSLDFQNYESFETQMTPGETALSWLFGFMLQLVIMTFVVPDENMELIAAWKWAVVMVLQTIVVFAIIFAIAFLLAGGGFAAEASQILTRVV